MNHAAHTLLLAAVMLATAATLIVMAIRPPSAVASLAPAQSVEMLNRQRAVHGIPSGIRERSDWSAGCQKHWLYMKLNNVLEHDEDPSKPGYSEAGAWAGRSSVLSWVGWADATNPWEHAPIHLMQLLGPELEQMGVWEGCATTWPGYTRSFPGRALYSYPGANATGHYFEERAAESPFVPGDFVGLPQGSITGPHLYVLAAGATRGRLTSATLTGPSGAVAVRTVDNSVARLGDYLPPGGIIIPVQPLKPRALYTARAVFSDDFVPLQREWSFRTRGREPHTYLTADRDLVRVWSKSPAPITVRAFSEPSGALRGQAVLRGVSWWRHRLAGGRWRFCFSQDPAGEYNGASGCSEATWRERPSGRLSRGRRRQQSVVFTLTVGRELIRRPVQVTVQRSRRRCTRLSRSSPRRCRLIPDGRPKLSSRRLSGKTALRTPLPRRGGRVRITVAAQPFSRGGILYSGLRLSRRYP